MMEREATSPFLFVGCIELQEILGKEAENEKELADLLDEVPLDSIYYHTHSYFLRHPFVAGLYPSDFATWVAVQVRDHILGERLAIVDPFDFANLAVLREEILSIVDDHLSRMAIVPRVVFGEPFYFKQSRIVEVSTGLEARTLTEFRNALADVDASAIYFHLLEARMRLNRREGDFSVWLRECLQMPELADAIGMINPYLGSLEQLRSKLLTTCDVFVKREGGR